MKWTVVLIEAYIAIIYCVWQCSGQRIPLPPQNFQNNQSPQNVSNLNLQILQQQQKQQSEELASVKDENIKRVLLELSTLQTPSQLSETMARVASLVGPLFIFNFDQRKDQIITQTQGRDASTFPQRLISAVTDIQGEEVKALVLQKRLDSLHAVDFAFLPLAIQYGLQDDILRNLSGTKLASVIKANPGDTVVAYKIASALTDQPDQQMEFLQSVGSKLLPEVQRIIMRQLLEWWGDPHNWKDRELSLLTSAGSPLLAYIPQSLLASLDDELADRFVTTLGQTQDIARSWWRKPMSLKKAWFEVAKGARYFGAVHEWSFRRMQKLSFLLEGATPEDLELIPPVPEIKGLVIGNHYTELQARIVFDAFYSSNSLSQEDLQEFQFHVLDLIPAQLQRFDFADSFGTLDEMMSIMERQDLPSYPTVLQISYFMWPIVNASNTVMTIAPPAIWQKRELSQIGKMFYLLPKSTMSQIKPDIINWDSNILSAIRSSHLSQFQTWKLTSQILQTVDDRFKPDYIFMIPSPFQKGIPSQNISQALLGSTSIRPEILRALIEETSGMLVSQKAVILQRIMNRIGEAIIIRTMVSSSNPSEMFKLVSPKLLAKSMSTMIKTIVEMPETGRFGITSIQAKLLPKFVLSIWLSNVKEAQQVNRWTAEDLLGRSSLGATNELNFAIMGLSCRDIDVVDPWDILSVIMHYRHELYVLRRFNPNLVFTRNLRNCVLSKFIEYLKEKRFLDDDQSDGHILEGITPGEIEAVGGEILTRIPTQVLDPLALTTRLNIIKEIGSLQMMELFSLVPLSDLHWYGNTLFRDIEIVSSTFGVRRRRQAPTDVGAGANDTSTTAPDAPANPDIIEVDSSTALPNPGIDSRSIVNATDDTSTLKHGIDLDALNTMGNLICYADNLFEATWPRTLLKDVLEAKTSIGEKTCCLTKLARDRWFQLLQGAYGSDPSSWNEFDLASIGDLLLVVPEADLQKISLDSLGKAVTPIMRQSGYALGMRVPGEIKRIKFVTACTEALGTDGVDFITAFKTLMKRLFQASQWMVNTVKTTQELIRDGVGRTGRIPRWAEHGIVKRQIPISIGGDIAYTGTSSPAYSPAVTNPQSYPSSPGAGISTYPQQANPTMATAPLGSSQQAPTQSYGGYTSTPPQSQVYMPAGSGIATPQQSQYSQTQYSQSAPAYTGQPPQSAPAYSSQPAVGGSPSQIAPSAYSPQPANTAASYPPQVGQPSAPALVQPVLPSQQQQQQTRFAPLPSVTNTQSYQQPQDQSLSSPQPLSGSPSQTAPVPSTSYSQQGYPPQGVSPYAPDQVSGRSSPDSLNSRGYSYSPSAPPPTANQYSYQANLPYQQAGAQQTDTTGFGQTQQPVGGYAPQFGVSSPPGPGTIPQQQYGTGVMPDPSQQPISSFGQQSVGGSATGAIAGNFGGAGSLAASGTSAGAGAASATAGAGVGGSFAGSSAQTNTNLNAAGANAFSQAGNIGQPGGNFGPGGSFGGSAAGAASTSGLGPGGSFGGNAALGAAAAGNVGQADVSQTNSQANTFATRGVGSNTQQRLLDPQAADTNAPFQQDSGNREISCNGIKAAGDATIGLTIDDLSKLSRNDLFDCVEELGKIEWDDETQSRILTLLKQNLAFSKDSIDASTLIEMGDLVRAFNTNPNDATIPSDGLSNTTTSSNATTTTIHSDISMIDLTLPFSLDILSILGQKIVDPLMLKSLADKFNQDNRIFPGFAGGIARPENLRIAVMSLGNIICGLNDKIVNSLFETDPHLLVDTSMVMGKLEGCSTEVLSTLASHAVRPGNYGPTRLWSQEYVEALGVIFAGLKTDNIEIIPAESMQGLTALAVKNMKTSALLSFSVEQMSKMSYNGAKALTPAQLNSLTPAQSDVIRSILQISPELFNVPVVAATEDPQQHPDLVERNLGSDTGNRTGVIGRADLPDPTTSTTPAPMTPDENATDTTTPQPDVNPETEKPSPSSAINRSSYSSLNVITATLLPVIFFLRI